MGVNRLVPVALAVVVLTVLLGTGAIVLNDMTDAAYDDVTVENETFNATSDPFTYTVAKASDADFVRIEDGSVTVYESSAQTTALDPNQYNVTDAEAGEVTISTTLDSGDESIDYTALKDNDAAGVFGTGITAVQDLADFLTIIVVVAIAAVIFLMLRMLRGSGQAAAR